MYLNLFITTSATTLRINHKAQLDEQIFPFWIWTEAKHFMKKKRGETRNKDGNVRKMGYDKILSYSTICWWASVHEWISAMKKRSFLLFRKINKYCTWAIDALASHHIHHKMEDIYMCANAKFKKDSYSHTYLMWITVEMFHCCCRISIV